MIRSFGALITLVALDALPEAIQLSNVFHKKKFSSEDLEVQDYMLVVAPLYSSQNRPKVLR